MTLKRNDNNRDVRCLHDMCERYMNYHVFFTMKDGSKFDGIIESVDENYVIVLVGEDIVDYGCENESYEQRQFVGPRRFRRFRRRVFPLSSLATLILLTFPLID